MTLDDLRATILRSTADRWRRVDGEGTTYLYRLGDVMSWSGGEERHWIDIEAHHSRVVYRPDIAVGMAWGMPRGSGGEAFHEDWVERFSDPKAFGAWLDILYHGQPVDRLLYVVVDGGRCKLPLPEQIFAHGFGVGPRERRLWVTREDYDLLRLVNEIDSGVDYDRYMNQAGFDVPPAGE